jgi:hypothetical protein
MEKKAFIFDPLGEPPEFWVNPNSIFCCLNPPPIGVETKLWNGFPGARAGAEMLKTPSAVPKLKKESCMLPLLEQG